MGQRTSLLHVCPPRQEKNDDQLFNVMITLMTSQLQYALPCAEASDSAEREVITVFCRTLHELSIEGVSIAEYTDV